MTLIVDTAAVAWGQLPPNCVFQEQQHSTLNLGMDTTLVSRERGLSLGNTFHSALNYANNGTDPPVTATEGSRGSGSGWRECSDPWEGQVQGKG